MAAERSFLDRDGVRLTYFECGRGPGKAPLLLVHGWCCDHSYWREQIAEFAADHRVVAVDLRGHGASDKPRQPYTVEGFAADLVWLADELELEHPVVIGHSMGGAIAACLGASYPTFARALVLVDPAVLIPEERTVEMREAMLGPDPKAFAATLIDGMFVASSPPALIAEITTEMLSAPDHVLASAGANLWQFDSPAAIRALTVPTLIVSASGMGDYHGTAARLNPRIEVEILPETGHFLQLERPDLLNPMLHAFLRRVER